MVQAGKGGEDRAAMPHVQPVGTFYRAPSPAGKARDTRESHAGPATRQIHAAVFSTVKVSSREVAAR
jgi:hypothetical protein